ncbi:uncharacterized protein LOC143838742 isoform X2 [Paroedura picta]|uniref:uncharacterized protein LOC143838742 isoform X2 n=1 Tax=Paroedura picta TaxID=143630 RepID=UPI0040573B08
MLTWRRDPPARNLLLWNPVGTCWAPAACCWNPLVAGAISFRLRQKDSALDPAVPDESLPCVVFIETPAVPAALPLWASICTVRMSFWREEVLEWNIVCKRVGNLDLSLPLQSCQPFRVGFSSSHLVWAFHSPSDSRSLGEPCLGEIWAPVKMSPLAGLLFCLVGSLLSSSWAEAPEAKSPCPYGTFSYTDGYLWFCYEFYGYSLPFEEAEAICQQNRNGGHLASITNDEETRMISGYVSRMNQNRGEVWIGLHRRQNSDMNRGWNWLDGSYFSYANWLGGTPNNIGGKQLCVVLTPGSGFKNWDDASCSYGRAFLCRWRVF